VSHPKKQKAIGDVIGILLYNTCTMLASPAAPRRSGNNSNRPSITRGEDDDEQQQQQQQQPPLRVEEDEEEIARAAAAVSVMGGGDGSRRQRPVGMEAANAAIQGTAMGDGGEAQAFEVVDEGGELVRVRFHEFLQN